jgi:hypothetical protein
MSQVCKRCGEWEDECTCGNKPKPKPTYEELTAENERLLRVVEQGSWSKSFPSEPGLYLLNRWGTFTAMRVLEGGLVHPANHKGRMAEMFSRRTISGSWFGPIEEDK